MRFWEFYILYSGGLIAREGYPEQQLISLFPGEKFGKVVEGFKF